MKFFFVGIRHGSTYKKFVKFQSNSCNLAVKIKLVLQKRIDYVFETEVCIHTY